MVDSCAEAGMNSEEQVTFHMRDFGGVRRYYYSEGEAVKSAEVGVREKKLKTDELTGEMINL